MSSLRELQKHLKAFRDAQRGTGKLVEEIASKRNELSFINPDQIESVFGAPLASISKFSMALDNEIYAMKKKLDKKQIETKDSLEQIQSVVNKLQTQSADCPVDMSFLHDLVVRLSHCALASYPHLFSIISFSQAQLLEQSAVEALAVAKMTNYDDASLDQDMFVTLITAFKYSPYLRQTDVDLVLDLTIK